MATAPTNGNLVMRTRSQRIADLSEGRSEAEAQSKTNGFEMVRIQTPGRGSKIVALWPRRADKTSAEFSALWGILDGRINSATSMASRLIGEMDAAMTNVNLSPVGRREAVANVARAAAVNLKGPAVAFLKARDAFHDKDTELAGVEPYDVRKPWQWAQDIESARVVRALPDDERLALRRALEMGHHPEIAEGLLRVPAYLTGIPADKLGNIRAALIEAKNPGYGEQAEVRSSALKAAADGLDQVAKMIEAGFHLDTEEARVLMGAEVAEVRVFAGQPIVELREMVGEAVTPSA